MCGGGGGERERESNDGVIQKKRPRFPDMPLLEKKLHSLTFHSE